MWQRFGLQSSRHPFALSRVAKEQRQLLLLKHDQVNVVVGIKEVQYIVWGEGGDKSLRLLIIKTIPWRY